MTAESELRALLLDNQALIATVPAPRISVDSVAVEQPRPYIVFSVQSGEPTFGLGNDLLAENITIDIQCIGVTRRNAVVVRELVKQALLDGGVPWSGTSSGYDPDADIEAEVITVNWLT